jgi:hypothetical protein
VGRHHGNRTPAEAVGAKGELRNASSQDA